MNCGAGGGSAEEGAEEDEEQEAAVPDSLESDWEAGCLILDYLRRYADLKGWKGFWIRETQNKR